MIEITSSILKRDEFKYTADTLIQASAVDGEEKFREHTIDYINDSSDTNDDMYFFDMLEFTRFLVPHKADNDEHIAYTTPDGLIYLNCPSDKVGKDMKVWEFIYDHECLHQLWETFDVENQIKKAGLEYNHMILNIASDCVINDYLRRIRHKKPFENGIFPEVLKEKFDVEYSPMNDTQFSLYIKLLEKKKEIMKDKQLAKMANDSNDQSGDAPAGSGQSENGQSGDQKDGKGQSGDQKDDKGQSGDKKDGKGQSGDQKDDKDNSGKGKSDNDKSGDQKDDKGQSADKKDGKGQSGDQKDGKDNSDNGQAGDDQSGNKDNKEVKWGRGQGSNEKQVDADLAEIRKKIEDIKNKYKDQILGDIGEFIKKCKSSERGEKNGLVAKTTSGISGWDVDMNKILNSYVRKKLFQKRKQYEPTFKRLRRGTAFKSGDILKPDRRVKEDKLNISFAFYIDKSGSMVINDAIDKVFKAVYIVCEDIRKKFRKDKLVSDTEFKIIAFDDYFYDIKYGKKCAASQGNMDFGELAEGIVNKTNDFLVNIIITDGQFDVNKTTAVKFLNKLTGILLFIVNNDQCPDFKELSKEFPTKMFFIRASDDFKLDKQ